MYLNFAEKSGKFRNIKKNLCKIGTLELFEIVWNAFILPVTIGVPRLHV